MLLGALLLAACCNKYPTTAETIDAQAFDTTLNGQKVSLYTLHNAKVMTAQITNYGARIVALWVPDAKGRFRDVVWGFSSIADYLNSADHFCGPIVGRYGNRIAHGQFALGDLTYQLTVNDGENHLHGGSEGLWSRVWTARSFTDSAQCEAVEMSYLSPNGEEGYPGNLMVKVTYTLLPTNALRIDYRATCDTTTIINLTSHSYFNLHGTSRLSTNTHLLQINADSFTPTDKGLIPTGEVAPVAGTPLDFTTPTAIGQRIESDCEPLRLSKGYDHNWVLRHTGQTLQTAAEVYEPESGIIMRVTTDQPALQFYSGNFMDGTQVGKRGDRHNFRTGIALETQNYPDAPNHANFPSALLHAGETYTHTCIYSFDVRK